MTGAHTNTNLGRQRADTERDRQVQGRQAGSDVCCRPLSIVSTPLKHRLTGLQMDILRDRRIDKRHRHIDRRAKTKTSRVSPYDCGRSSTVILHSVSAYFVSLLLLQNLLICKSIAYIFRSIHHLYFCAIYLPQGRG